ncbi:MAG TPA: alpha-glucan family phosphorylase [Actinomycetota bacterium]|nr:alpha-glucan family phosphorylase [Actinomycetota bacterium]
MGARGHDGSADVEGAVAALAQRLPEPLGPLAHLAYNYRWSWTPGGPDVFAGIDRERWRGAHENPVRLLHEADPGRLAAAADARDLAQTASALHEQVRAERSAPPAIGSSDRPVAFFCAEYGVHRSLPIYAGGLGVLAGDILKEASDQRVPLVGLGLLYRQGYFHQRLDPSGWQHEYWIEADPDLLPAVLVTDANGSPLTVTVPLRGREVVVQIWRVDVGRVALYLLDAERPENARSDRWITARLYVGDRSLRLAQYAVLGVAGVRALRAMGIEPSVIHLNEGHAALAPLEDAAVEIRAGRPVDEALAAARSKTVFTTHTPVAAGNETYAPEEIEAVLGDVGPNLELDPQAFLRLGRSRPDDEDEWFGVTPLGLRMSRSANAVSERHGQVAREMWQPLYPDAPVDQVPIAHVTNGVHLPTWMAPPMQALLDRHLGPEWRTRQTDAETWSRVDDVPDEELWAVRSELRASLIAYVRDRTVRDRLAREEPADYAEAAARSFDPNVLTVGFARRVAGYKRLTLLVHDPDRATALLSGPTPLQLLIAGKAHPQDELAKGMLQSMFGMKWQGSVPERVAFLEDYDLDMAAHLVSGCDVWVNVPRPPLEASGTSGMKAALNGALNLSILDGWWEEAFDGANGWGIQGHPDLEPEAQDDRDAAALYDLLEREVLPLFYQRTDGGLPRGWIGRIKASMRSIAPRFSATRMVRDYAEHSYRLG